MTSAVKPLSGIANSLSNERLLCLILVLLLAGCQRNQEPVQLAGETMGTTWHVTYISTLQDVTPERIQQGIEAQLEQVNRAMSTYSSDSEISRFNATAPLKRFNISPEFATVLQAALDVGIKSEGAYDVTVMPLVDLWGFGPTGPIDTPPDAQDIARLRDQVGQHNILVDGENLNIMKLHDLSLDLSSLAKGYGVDRVAQWLQEQGIVRYMIEVGGEMRLSGLSGRDDAWRIAVEQPESSERSVATILQLTNVGIATSGDYRNYFEADGRRYSHLIDPRTGYPVAHDLVSVTVVHASCMIADAWATALSVLGLERAMAVAKAQGLAVYFIHRVEDRFVHSHTPSFSTYLSPTKAQKIAKSEE